MKGSRGVEEAMMRRKTWGGGERRRGSTLWVAKPSPLLPPLLSSDWRQSVLGVWAEGRDGWGVGAKEWEVIGGALHWLTKRQCTKIKPVGREMAQSSLYNFCLYQKDCGNNQKWHTFNLWRRSASTWLCIFFPFLSNSYMFPLSVYFLTLPRTEVYLCSCMFPLYTVVGAYGSVVD